MVISTPYDKYIRQVRLAQHIPVIACEIINMQKMGDACICKLLQLELLVIDLNVINTQIKQTPVSLENDVLFNNSLSDSELQDLYESVFEELECVLPPLGSNYPIPDETMSSTSDTPLNQFIGAEDTNNPIVTEEGTYILLENVTY